MYSELVTYSFIWSIKSFIFWIFANVFFTGMVYLLVVSKWNVFYSFMKSQKGKSTTIMLQHLFAYSDGIFQGVLFQVVFGSSKETCCYLFIMVLHHSYFEMDYIFSKIINISTFAAAAPLIDAGWSVHKDYKKMENPFVFCSGVLAKLQTPDFNVKALIQKHVKEITENSSIFTEFQFLKNAMQNGNAGIVTDRINCLYSGGICCNIYFSFALASLMWRMAPISYLLIHPLLWIVSKLKQEYRLIFVKLIAEAALTMTTDAILLGVDTSELKGSATFISKDTSAVVAVNADRREIYDAREKFLFGDNRSLCPGRFFVTSLWLQQQKDCTLKCPEKALDSIQSKEKCSYQNGEQSFLQNITPGPCKILQKLRAIIAY